MAHFPLNYKCPDEHQRMYPELEREMLPFLKAKAVSIQAFTKGMLEMDDALQEGRLALLSALIGYNEDKGKLKSYVGKILDNTYCGMMYSMLSVTKMPQHHVLSASGVWEEKPRPPVTLNATQDEAFDYIQTYWGGATTNLNDPLAVEGIDPETMMTDEQLEAEAKVFKLKLLNSLKGKDKEVFGCKTNPPIGFLKMIENKGGDIYAPTNVEVAEYLKLTKNAVDWSVYKIKEKFTHMARNQEFSDLFGDHVNTTEWPMIYTSKKSKHDVDFVRKIIIEKELDPNPLHDYHQEVDFHQESGVYSRMIERYPWGVVLILRRETVWRTLVIAGEFNPITGGVFGTSGAREAVPVSWYQHLVKTLKTAEKKIA